jgi:GntR family transcriptional regulator of gluconate operon
VSRPAGTLEDFDPGLAPRKALWETIVETIRRAIVLGELPAGLHLEEPALAQKFGVSRIPIREALVRLEHEGLVRSEPRRGSFIVGMTEEDVSDIYELRELFECRAARRAAGRIDPAGIARLEELASRMDEALARRDPQAMVEPDVEFHRRIVLSAGSRQLLAAWDRLAGLIGTMLGITDTTYYNAPTPSHGHRRIIESLHARDADAAEREIQAHLQNGERVMREAIRAVRVVPVAR